MPARRIVSKHLLRRMARREMAYLEHLWVRAGVGSATARIELRERGLAVVHELHIERAGRVRARWVVIAQ